MMERLLLFGTGQFYIRRREALSAFLGQDEVVGFLDNRAQERRMMDGLPVYLPEELSQISYDRILLMSASVREMREQLLGLGIPSSQISFYEEYRARKTRDTFLLPLPKKAAEGKKRILIIAHDMEYDGGSIVAVYAAKVLQIRGHVVTLTAPSIQPALAQDIRTMGVDFVLCPTLPYLGEREKLWIKQYEILVANVFHNSPVACSMRKELPVIWWIHEAGEAYSNIYPRIRYQFSEYDTPKQMDGIRIFGVSRLAADVFSRHYPSVPVGVLPYGIPDHWNHLVERHDVPVFAIVGTISALKGQLEFLQATRLLRKWQSCGDFEVWVIGAKGSRAYDRNVMELMQSLPFAHYKGVLTRSEMEEAYQRIDVVVCASQEETLSAVCIEGLMHAKVCLTTRNTGIADYLSDGVNGFLCQDNKPEHLAGVLERILDVRSRWEAIGHRGRDVYEANFSFEKFGNRLERELQFDTIDEKEE